MLVATAAKRWNVDPSTWHTENSAVVQTATGTRLSYSALVEESAKLPVPVNPKPKDPKNYQYVGEPSPRIDSPEESNGKAQFGIDVRLPGMLQDGLWPLRESRNHSRPSAALKGEITIANGRVEQSNFNDYDLLRMNETPPSEVHMVQSADGPGGIGEPGTPIAPAVCNAIFAATGKPVRRLPIRTEDLA
jgi:CO/xanthine dehydrogenase Mo-binding subunit